MKITIYSTAACAACHTLTTWLDKQDISYEKKITDENEEYMAEFMEVNDGMVIVPFTIIEDDQGAVTKISGFDQKKLQHVLNS